MQAFVQNSVLKIHSLKGKLPTFMSQIKTLQIRNACTLTMPIESCRAWQKENLCTCILSSGWVYADRGFLSANVILDTTAIIEWMRINLLRATEQRVRYKKGIKSWATHSNVLSAHFFYHISFCKEQVE